jgi:hypothetical protein
MRLDKETMLSRLLEWSKQSGLAVARIEDPNTDFHLVISEPTLPSIDIMHPQPDSEFVLFAARVELPEELQKKLLDLGVRRRKELMTEIRINLLSMKQEFAVSGQDSGFPRSYNIFSRLFLKDSTVQTFWNTYVDMKSTIVLIISLHQKFLELS